MAKHTDLPWDLVFSSELVSSYKPYASSPSMSSFHFPDMRTMPPRHAPYHHARSRNPKVYSGVAHYLQLPPQKVAMVAAHVDDLRGAAAAGLRTIYVRRGTEDAGDGIEQRTGYKPGEFDIVVDSLTELAEMFV